MNSNDSKFTLIILLTYIRLQDIKGGYGSSKVGQIGFKTNLNA